MRSEKGLSDLVNWNNQYQLLRGGVGGGTQATKPLKVSEGSSLGHGQRSWHREVEESV